jgi:hypothetical protein
MHRFESPWFFLFKYCYVVAAGYYRAEEFEHPKSKAMTRYVWSIVAPLWKMYSGSSGFNNVEAGTFSLFNFDLSTLFS